MAKPNPSFEKRRRERLKKERREEKARRKAERKAAAAGNPSADIDMGATEGVDHADDFETGPPVAGPEQQEEPQDPTPERG